MSGNASVYGPTRGEGVSVCEPASESLPVSGVYAPQPPGELETNGFDACAEVANVRSMLAARPARDARGSFTRDNPGRTNVDGDRPAIRSEAFWQAIDAAKHELIACVQNDVHADAGAAETLRGLIDAYAEVRLMRESLWLTVAEAGGPTTTKGRIRACYTAFVSAVASEERLAKTIGLSRRQKQAIDLAVALTAPGAR